MKIAYPVFFTITKNGILTEVPDLERTLWAFFLGARHICFYHKDGANCLLGKTVFVK